MHFLIFILLLVPGIDADGIKEEYKQLLDRGLMAERQGNYKEALDIWLKAKAELQVPSTAIGRHFIRVVTEQGIEDYYESASHMYYWGISAESIESDWFTLKQELDFLAPLLSEDQYRKWNQLYKDRDPELYAAIRTFWNKLDPTPSTSYNERLIEHWNRIAYARKHYSRNDNSVFGTDSRGPVYVAYGKPDHTYTGRLELTYGYALTIARIIDKVSSTESLRRVANAAMELFQNQEYEIWSYEFPDEKIDYNLVKIFSVKAGGGSFDLLETVEDFIPNTAFTLSKRYELSRRSPTRLNPAMILQWAYYEQLAPLDPYFATFFNRIQFQWDRIQHETMRSSQAYKALGRLVKEENRYETEQNNRKAPVAVSQIEKNLPDIPVEVFQYRMLTPQNKPVFLSFFETQPRDIIINDFAYNQEILVPDQPLNNNSTVLSEAFGHYRLIHGLHLRNSDWELLAQEKEKPAIILDSDDENTPTASVFKIPYVSTGTHQIFFAEIHNYHPETAPLISTPFPRHLRGLGKVVINQPDPLDVNPVYLEMSDIILGYQLKEEPSKESLLPFVVANDREIPAGENIVVHFEVYHLELNKNDLTNFQISYEILPLNFLGWEKTAGDEISLTLNYETGNPYVSEDLEIKTRDLETGKYVLKMSAKDLENGNTTNREIKFKIIDE